MQKVLLPYRIVNDLPEINLVVDSARPHSTEKVKLECRQGNINQSLIPPRMTNHLQPADVCWFSQIKCAYHRRWCDWILYEEKTYTKNGNACSLGYVKCIQWLSDIWGEMDPLYIAQGFEACGLASRFNLHST